jgi:isopentenyl diphosphate isomerase/L-lactate dehydrogenase-like FMN-dependent dehydrogenase
VTQTQEVKDMNKGALLAEAKRLGIEGAIGSSIEDLRSAIEQVRRFEDETRSQREAAEAALRRIEAEGARQAMQRRMQRERHAAAPPIDGSVLAWGEADRRAIDLMREDPAAFTVLARRLAHPEESISDTARALGVKVRRPKEEDAGTEVVNAGGWSRQAIYRGVERAQAAGFEVQ